MTRYPVVAIMVGLAAMPAPAFAGKGGWAKASDAGRNLLVVAALGVPAVQSDWHGDLQAAESLAAAGGTTFTLKELIHERRPDGSDNKSFPSGHTSMSFAAAATLENRYGWKAGLPALVIAGFVGLARVEADKHYAHDVLAGAGIGLASGFLLTHKRSDRVMLTPWAMHGGGGIDMAVRF
ncbi:phospholipid phosphatase [Sphingomonas sp. Leaf339]|uniref:phosphatase PAP2 family protein n=1 Tax=Sphingomonas sp. Leaf339 TaxID=1736343 RepID=UPI0006F91F64|nr:phosphatase PAP2 family protein [Sphingomonas sp. Leaf339]KQU61632.1 phospholipid phosphatase [Sphingomonas sp. Leaf339]